MGVGYGSGEFMERAEWTTVERTGAGSHVYIQIFSQMGRFGAGQAPQQAQARARRGRVPGRGGAGDACVGDAGRGVRYEL